MSAVTLETLRADFEGTWSVKEFGLQSCLDMIADHADRGRQYHEGSDGFHGTVYVIARDFGLDAAMLFKLSGGNIDPRVSA